MHLPIFAALLATAFAQSISPPPYTAPSPETTSAPSTILYTPPGTFTSSSSSSSTEPSISILPIPTSITSSSEPIFSILPIYPITTAISNMMTPIGTGAVYCPTKKNGTDVVAPTAVPTRYTDPETPMDPAEYGGGAMGLGVEVGMMGLVFVVVVFVGGMGLL